MYEISWQWTGGQRYTYQKTIFQVIFVFDKSLRWVYSSGYLINFSCMSSQAVINKCFYCPGN